MRSPPWSLDAAAPEPDGEGMTGIPGSPGCAVAPAYIVRSPDDFADCPAGAILVVRATTPAWTALFARAAGIIAESGGPLSHGAIAAREQGIPAVMAVRDAMARLVNGQVVRLDGSHGTVGLVA
jgi:phosphoenolpyruvate synthase/pyruvate phosphate dikinase